MIEERLTKKLGLYIHIPFCVRKCNYCDFLSMPAGSGTQKAYVDELIEEIKYKALVFQDLGSDPDAERVVDSIYIGGGTPSILMPGEILRIMKTVRREFNVDPEAEISMEINPGTLELENSDEKIKSINNEGDHSFTNNGINKCDNKYREEKVSIWKEAGINRISIGLQSADNRELQLLGRIHTYEEFLENYHFLRDKGFDNINVDLISALPGQKLEEWENTLRIIACLKPEHISSYSLIIEENTPFYDRYSGDLKALENGDIPKVLPSEDQTVSMLSATEKILTENGYFRYEISNYAKMGYNCRHNIRYWRRGDYIGFGIGAASLFKDKRYKNITDLKGYLGLFTKEEYLHYKSIYEEIIELNEKDKMEEFMFLGFRMMEGVDLDEFEALHPGAFGNHYEETFLRLEKQGLLENFADRRWRLTPHGINVSNYVLADMLL